MDNLLGQISSKLSISKPKDVAPAVAQSSKQASFPLRFKKLSKQNARVRTVINALCTCKHCRALRSRSQQHAAAVSLSPKAMTPRRTARRTRPRVPAHLQRIIKGMTPRARKSLQRYRIIVQGSGVTAQQQL